jgi:hypothetical protein
MTSGLKDLLQKCLGIVAKDPSHHFNLGYREAVNLAMGPKYFETVVKDISGYKRRVKLALLSVTQVKELWHKAWPEDNTIQYIINKIKELIINFPRNKIDQEKVVKDIDRLWEYTVGLTDKTRNIAGVAGMAAVEAYSLAYCDDFMSEDYIDYNISDSDDFMLNDVHFYASSVFADGPPYSIALAPASDPIKRKEFWEWWLKEAVPSAWNTVG